MSNAVEALIPSVLCHFPRDRFFDLVTSHPRLSYERMAYLAVWLVQRGEDTGLAKDGVLEVTVTQTQIADMLGLSLVHTNRTLQGLRRDGLVEWNLSRIAVRDMAAASRFAQFDKDEHKRPYL
jgi:CRP-like cAMP-binding protein